MRRKKVWKLNGEEEEEIREKKEDCCSESVSDFKYIRHLPSWET